MIDHNLLHLLHLADPTLPIGGFAHSAGLETYVQKKIVCDHPSALSFIKSQLSLNIQYTDAAFVSLAFDATINNNWHLVSSLDRECTAVKLPREIREASQKLGIRLLKIFEPLCAGMMGTQYLNAIKNKELSGHYSIVFGMYGALLKLGKKNLLTGFYYNAAVGMVTNSVKLIPLSQQQGQQLLYSLKTLIDDLSGYSMEPDPELIGLCCTGFDIRCMQHEQLYSRLYMS